MKDEKMSKVKRKSNRKNSYHPGSKFSKTLLSLTRLGNLKQLFNLAFILIGIIIIVVLVQKIQEYQSLKSNASAGTAKIFFVPESINIPPDGIVKLFATVDKDIAFARIEMLFDHTQVRLTQDIMLTNQKLTRVISKSTPAQANETGKIIIVIALDPTNRTQPPSGTIELANLKFSSITTTPNQSSSISINTANSQMIAITTEPYNLTSQICNIQLNYVAPTPPPTPSPSVENANLIKNASFENNTTTWYEPWQIQTSNGASGTIVKDTKTFKDGQVSAKISSQTITTNWHMQFMQDNISVKSGEKYIISFWAKSQSNRKVEMAIQKVGSPYTQYLNQKVNLTKRWTKYSFTFKPTVSDNNVKLTFMLGDNTRSVWFDKVSISQE
jgi:hypothetical protein